MRNRLSSTENSAGPSLHCDVEGHTDQEITHFCCNKDCMTPLCQECIQIHSEYHHEINKVAIFKTFRDVKDASFIKIKNFTDKVETKLVGLNALLLRSEIEQASGLETLSKCKARVLTLVNSLFEELESNYRILMEQERSKKTKIADQASEQLKIILDDLRNQQENLDSVDCIHTIKEVYAKNYDSELEKVLIQTNVLELESKGPSGVVVHPDLQTNITRVLKDYIKIGRSNSDSSQATNCGSCLEQSVDIKASVYFTPNVMSQQESDFIENLGRISSQEKSLPVESNESLLRSEGPGKVDIKVLSTKDMISVYQRENNEEEISYKKQEKAQVQEEEKKEDGSEREEDKEEDDVDEIMTQQTVYSSEFSEPALREEDDHALSDIESNMSENIVFEEIPESPAEGEE